MSTEPAPRRTLRRVLGWRIAMAVVVGNVIGSGIFLKPGNIAGMSGQFGVIMAVWVAGGVLCILGALCFAELATMLPKAGGMYVYLRHAYGRPVAFLFGWSELLFSRPASIGALGMALVYKIELALDRDIDGAYQVALVAALVAAMAWINIVSVLWGGRFQMVITVVKAAFLALVALSPLLLLPFAQQRPDVANYASTLSAMPSTSLSAQIGAVLLAVMWAYNGWHAITPLAEEVRRPQRNIPLALFAGVGVLIALYLGANLAYHSVLTMDEMQAAGEHAAEQMLGRLVGEVGSNAVMVFIAFSIFGAINTNLLQAPRIIFAMGRDGTFFRDLGRVHATYRTPVVAILVTAVMSVLLVAAVVFAKNQVAAGDASATASAAVQEAAAQRTSAAPEQDPTITSRIIQSLKTDSAFELLTNFVIFSASIFYMLGVAAVIVLRWRDPERKRPYRTWGYPLVPILFLAVYGWFLTQVYRDYPLESRTGLILIAAGIPVYFAYQWKSRRAAARS